MNLTPNKQDAIQLPITTTRIAASEWNQLVGSCMAFIIAAGLTPDGSDPEQFLNAFKKIAANLELVGANTNLSNLTATGQAKFDAKADLIVGQLISMLCTPSYVPSGTLPCDGTQYAQTQFNDLWTNYLTATTPLLPTCTYTEYETDIATYGQCAKFAVDTTNLTFKVPTIKDGAYLTQARTDAELGKAYNESLPNATGEFSGGLKELNVMSVNGGMTKRAGGSLGNQSSGGTGGSYIGYDLSLSSSTYQDGAKVQGDNIRTRFFIVVANGEINQSQMDWAAWASSLAGKANTDLSNVNSSGKGTVVGWGISSYASAVSKSINTIYTATTAGVLFGGVSHGGTSLVAAIYVNDVLIASWDENYTSYNWSHNFCIPVDAGDTYQFYISAGSMAPNFAPLKGVN